MSGVLGMLDVLMLTLAELHIRTTSVLLTLEQEQQNNQQAVIFTHSLALG